MITTLRMFVDHPLNVYQLIPEMLSYLFITGHSDILRLNKKKG